VLFYDEKDAERQFGMSMNSRLTPKDIPEPAPRPAPPSVRQEGNVVLTVGELLATEDLELDFDPADRGRDTRVRTAVAWLENAALLERNENRTRFFPRRCASSIWTKRGRNWPGPPTPRSARSIAGVAARHPPGRSEGGAIDR
jgi:hypothetical protein